MASLLPTSRFKYTSLIKTKDGKDTYSRMEGFDALKNISGENFQFYTVPNTVEGRPDLIASNFYGNQHLEWVLVIANHPTNPLNWPKSGDIIKIPNRSFINGLL